MTNLKTLKELFDAGGGKPVKVRRDFWEEDEWFVAYGVMPNGRWLGYNSESQADHWEGEKTEWSLYQEPKKQRVETWVRAVMNYSSAEYLCEYFKTEEEARKHHTFYGLAGTVEVIVDE